MGLYEKAKIALADGDLLKALELFEVSYKTESRAGCDPVKLNTLLEIQNILITLDKGHDLYFASFLSTAFEELGRIEYAIQYYAKLLSARPSKVLYEKIIKIHFDIGNVHEAKVLLSKYLHFLKDRRDFDTLAAFINEVTHRKHYFSDSDYYRWLLIVHLQTGNIKGVENLIENEDVKDTYGLSQLFLYSTTRYSSYWNQNSTINNYILKNLPDLDTRAVTKKRVIKLLIDTYLISYIDHELLDNSLNIAKKWSLSNFGYELAKVLSDPEMESYFVILIPKEQMGLDSYDLGLDLLDDKNIVEDASFSHATGNKKEAAAKMNYIKDKELLSEFKKINYSFKNLPEDQDDKHFLSLVNYYDDDYLFENYEELVVSFNMMQLFDVSSLILDRVISHNHRGDFSYINLYYLKIEVLMRQEKYFDARDLCEDVLSEQLLSKDERILFSYLRAENYYHLGQVERSYKIFLSIKKKINNYRLTDKWIAKIEKTQ